MDWNDDIVLYFGLPCAVAFLVGISWVFKEKLKAMFSVSNILLILMCAGFACYLYFYTTVPMWSVYTVGLLGAVIAFLFSSGKKKETEICAQFAGYSWDRNDFARHWLITGATGTGKTVSAIFPLMDSVFKWNPKKEDENAEVLEYGWGGACIDDKGTFWESLVSLAECHDREDDLILLQTKPEWADSDWKPKAVYNPLSDMKIPANTYADAIATCYETVNGDGSGEKGFFVQQATSNIAMGIELARCLNRFPCLNEINDILQSEDMLKGALKRIERSLSDRKIPGLEEKARIVLSHFKEKFLNQPAEQLGGVKSTIHNYLNYFSTPDVVSVFGQPSGNTVDFSEIDKGKIFCISMPQSLSIERRYVGSLLKVLYLQHSLRRFDKLEEDRKSVNLIILWCDEAQRFLSGREDVDVLREAKSAIVVATQMHNGFYPVMGRELADVFTGNLSNRIAFRASKETCAEETAKYLGKKYIWKRSHSYGRGGKSVSKSKEEQYKVPPIELMDEKKFPKFKAIVYHCSKGYKKIKLPILIPPVLKERAKKRIEMRKIEKEKNNEKENEKE